MDCIADIRFLLEIGLGGLNSPLELQHLVPGDFSGYLLGNAGDFIFGTRDFSFCTVHKIPPLFTFLFGQ
jgi:hypothetical protein